MLELEEIAVFGSGLRRGPWLSLKQRVGDKGTYSGIYSEREQMSQGLERMKV